MASITIQHSHRNLLLAANVANETGATFEEEGQWITISDSPELCIPRGAFENALDPDGMRAQRGEANLDRHWRSLLLNKRGHLVHFDEHEIVIADEKPAKPAGFLLRFPSDEEKAQAEEWAERAGFDSLTAYILAAVEAFNRHWQEQAGEKPARVDLYEDNAGGLYLVCGDRAWEVSPDSGTFAEDAPAAIQGDTDSWWPESMPAKDVPGELVATYEDGRVSTVEQHGILRAGSAAREYLGLPRED